MSNHVNPPEPKGVGAVIETADGTLLIRYSATDLAPWIAMEGGVNPERPYRYYDYHQVVAVLSEGVEV